MPREIYNFNGELEDDELGNSEEPYLINVNRYEYSKDEQREFAEILSKIDFAALRKIFEKIGSHCGIKPDKLNFINSDKIELISKEEWGGSYDPKNNIIGINYLSAKQDRRYYGGRVYAPPGSAVPTSRIMREGKLYHLTPTSIITELVVLARIIHEETHAVSGRRKVGENDRLGYVSESINQSISQENRTFELLNEGVTEKLTREIASQYLEEKGTMTKQEIKYFLIDLTRESGRYPTVILVEQLISNIAKESKFSKDIVWQALIRGYFEGTDLLENKLAKFIDEQTFEGCVEQLKTLKIDEERSCTNRLWKKEVYNI